MRSINFGKKSFVQNFVQENLGAIKIMQKDWRFGDREIGDKYFDPILKQNNQGNKKVEDRTHGN